MTSQIVLRNTTIATMTADYGLLSDGAIAIQDGEIAWCGPEADLPGQFADLPSEDLAGRLVTPGLIDCHTHLVFGGDRAQEFEMRLNGASYEEVARAGGGIVSTVKATRQASVENLVAQALPRLDAMIAEGITTVEIKSGYGLNEEAELNMLRAARKLASIRPVRILTSYLGAHAVPKEYQNRPDAYIDEVCIPTLHKAHAEGLVDAVDGFCEGIAFDTAQIARVFDAATALGLPLKLHAEQLSNIGGTQLAAARGAMSVDHIEYANNDDCAALAKSGTVAVILPGAFYTLRETQAPPIDALRTHNVPMAVATDCNPGSSPMTSLLLAMNMACTLFRMTPQEALAGATRHAAQALGQDGLGIIQQGATADLAVWNVSHPAELSYRIGFNSLHKRYFGGVA
ncbi:imidazolonepropionase [Rhodophyticola sp. CCM32]|nr:imidazolonepropionase [Rhodophyticola sp. CCM32]QBY01445.1 imidazolonepropionase [Rhodophyticola sp. CCM32]